MVNEATKKGISDLCYFLDETTIIALATTVTQGLLKNQITTRDEALNAILNYSADGLSFLRRKIITREVIFEYLHINGVPVSLPVTKNDLIQKTANFWDIQYKEESNELNLSLNTADQNTIRQLAEQFTRWFYNMLNSDKCIDPEHFYSDAKLQINIHDITGILSSDMIEGDTLAIAQKLSQIKINFNLFFNPNVSGGGVQGKVDPHGLVLVLVCGTLHTKGSCVGVFEQMFGLVRDPQVQNNWKIKMTELILRSQSGQRTLN